MASRRSVSNEQPKNLQTAEKSRGWLEIGRFLYQIDRVHANYFSKNFRTSKQANKRTKQTKQTKNSKKTKRWAILKREPKAENRA